MSRPRLLDLFCGGGGAATGYSQAGFEVWGVDIDDQPHYPFRFFQGDAVDALATGAFLGAFDAVHASPPCQDHMSTPHRVHGTGWLLDATRQALLRTALPWVIENVDGADMRADFAICGCQVGLRKLRRVRYFEVSWGPRAGLWELPTHDHSDETLTVVGHGTPSWTREQRRRRGLPDPSIADYRAAMGIDWLPRDSLSQAIPPAYTEFVGKDLLALCPR